MEKRRGAADRLLAGFVAGTAAVLTLFATGLLPAGGQAVIAWSVVTVVHVFLVWVARSTARMPGMAAPNRRFWLAVAAGGVVYLLGDLAQLALAARDPFAAEAATGGRVQLIALSAGSALLMVTLLAVPVGFTSRQA